MTEKKNVLPESFLFHEISNLIEQSQVKVVSQVNSIMTLLFWQVGKRINEFILEHKRAEYGRHIVVTRYHDNWRNALAGALKKRIYGECCNLRPCFQNLKRSLPYPDN
jgi:DUF1016 N-terminal domain